MAENINQQTENVKPDPFEVSEEEKKAYAEYVKEMKKAKREKHSQADELLNLVQDLILFHDQYREGFVFLNKESIALRSKSVRQYLSKKLWEAHGKAASNETLSQVINVLEAKAVFDNPKVFLFNRVGKETNGDESFFYDLGDGKVVKVTDSGWIVCDAPILFRRYLHQCEQVLPIKGGNPFSLFKYLNIDHQYRLLTLSYIACCYVPEIPHPVFHPHGDHGSAKTTCCKIIRDLIDPSTLMTFFLPEDKRELVQILNHSWAPVFDNVSFLSDSTSDFLSQAVTGGGVSKRQLYTDSEDITYSFQRCIGLNGINVSVHKPDLLDRTILLSLERISNDKRKEKRDLEWV